MSTTSIITTESNTRLSAKDKITSFADFLFQSTILEVFDSPWIYTFNQDLTNEIKQYCQERNKENPEDILGYPLGYIIDGHGILITFIHNGYTEIHHQNEFGETGITNDKTAPNPRFYSTLIHFIKHECFKKYRPVKICSTDKTLFKHYVSLVNILKKKYKYNVEITTDVFHNEHRDVIIIKPAYSLQGFTDFQEKTIENNTRLLVNLIV